MGCHALLQAIFPTQGSSLHLLCLLPLAGRFFITSATWEAPFISLFINVETNSERSGLTSGRPLGGKGQSWDGKFSRSDSNALVFFPTSPSCPSYFPGIHSSVPQENLIMGLEPEYLMLSLWLFFLLIDGFTKVIFSLSSTYGPGLPNDVFVPGRAWSLFVLTAVPREGVWAPHVRGCGEQRSSTQS